MPATDKRRKQINTLLHQVKARQIKPSLRKLHALYARCRPPALPLPVRGEAAPYEPESVKRSN